MKTGEGKSQALLTHITSHPIIPGYSLRFKGQHSPCIVTEGMLSLARNILSYGTLEDVFCVAFGVFWTQQTFDSSIDCARFFKKHTRLSWKIPGGTSVIERRDDEHRCRDVDDCCRRRISTTQNTEQCSSGVFGR